MSACDCPPSCDEDLVALIKSALGSNCCDEVERSSCAQRSVSNCRVSVGDTPNDCPCPSQQDDPRSSCPSHSKQIITKAPALLLASLSKTLDSPFFQNLQIISALLKGEELGGCGEAATLNCPPKNKLNDLQCQVKVLAERKQELECMIKIEEEKRKEQKKLYCEEEKRLQAVIDRSECKINELMKEERKLKCKMATELHELEEIIKCKKKKIASLEEEKNRLTCELETIMSANSPICEPKPKCSFRDIGVQIETFFEKISRLCSTSDLRRTRSREVQCCEKAKGINYANLSLNSCSAITQVLWAVTRINVFAEGTKTYEIMDATTCAPRKLPKCTHGVFVVKASKKCTRS